MDRCSYHLFGHLYSKCRSRIGLTCRLRAVKRYTINNSFLSDRFFKISFIPSRNWLVLLVIHNVCECIPLKAIILKSSDVPTHFAFIQIKYSRTRYSKDSTPSPQLFRLNDEKRPDDK